MTNLEIERRLLQLEQNVIALATRQGIRANDADANNAKNESNLSSTKFEMIGDNAFREDKLYQLNDVAEYNGTLYRYTYHKAHIGRFIPAYWQSTTLI